MLPLSFYKTPAVNAVLSGLGMGLSAEVQPWRGLLTIAEGGWRRLPIKVMGLRSGRPLSNVELLESLVSEVKRSLAERFPGKILQAVSLEVEGYVACQLRGAKIDEKGRDRPG